jgi:UMF1 family MFS transporter
MFLFVKEKYSGNRQDKKDGLYATVQELYTTFREIKKYRQILRFLIARLVYNDGLVTIFAFGGIYAAGTFDFTFQEIMTFGVVLNISAGLGALTMGFLDDAVGGKKTIQVSLIGLTIASLIAVFAPNKTLFWIAGIIVGIFSGPNQSASRSLMARFIPEQKQGEFFGFFAFSGKFTAFVGPFLLGVLTGLFNSQRAGISVVVFMFVIGGIILSTIDEEEGKMVANRDQTG